MAEEMTQGNLGKVPASVWNRFTEVKAELKATYPDALAALIEDHERAPTSRASPPKSRSFAAPSARGRH